MSEHFSLITFLLLFIVARELFFMHTVNKLTNKLMSRNYQDYQFGERMIGKPSENKSEPQEFGPPEDLGALQGFF